MSMTTKERFAEDNGLTASQTNNLCTAAEFAAKAQERHHNANAVTIDREAKRADDKIKIFESLARVLGFTGVDWPGLYPTLMKGDRRHIELPLD